MPGELVRELAQRLDAEIVNLYGPTETCITSTRHRCGAEPDGIVPIGRPISNTQAYVLDRNLQPAPPGVRGELYLGGTGLALGYLNRAKLTAEKFLPHPFSAAAGARIYRTGDWARYRPDGNLEVLGRLDNQVKVRGYRIELEDVESALRACPSVSSAAAAVRSDRLIAYVVPSVAGSLQIEHLRSYARTHLPEYMVPSEFVLLDGLPLAPNGKIDRRGLPEPDPQGRQTVYVPPADALEARLAALWERLLQVSPVGREDNFFELGGHSLVALRMFAEIEGDFGSSIPVASLYEAPTVAQLAGLLRAGRWSPRWSSLIALQPSGRRAPLFCVHADAGHVFFYQDLAFRLGRDQPVYGLESQGLDGVADPLRSVEEMAAHYIKEMRDVQRSGPYLIGGFCFGAYIALEMAHQLQSQGESVPALISFNTDGAWKTVRSMGDSIRLHRRQTDGWHRKRVLGYIRERILYRLYRWSGAHAQVKAAAYRALGRRVPAVLRGLVIRELNFRAARQYVPRKYEGTLIYFQGSEDASNAPEPFWLELVSRIETLVVPGRGVEILREPGVQSLARLLELSLARLR